MSKLCLAFFPEWAEGQEKRGPVSWFWWPATADSRKDWYTIEEQEGRRRGGRRSFCAQLPWSQDFQTF
jgi:hypothetical protein